MADMLTTLADIGEDAVRMLVGIFEGIAASGKHKPGFNARFISEREILSTKHTGFCVTGRRNLSNKQSYSGLYVQSPTGGGKTTTVILPSLYSMTGSFIVHDPAGEIEKMSAGFLKEKGYEIKVLNFSRPDISCGFNPLTRANTSTEIQKTANMLVTASLGENAKDPFWNVSATSLLSNLISVIKTQPAEMQTPYALLQLLNLLSTAPKTVLHFFKTHANDAVWSDFSAFMHQEEKVRSSVIATCRAALQIFSDPEGVGKITAFDNLHMEDFRNKKCVLYIQNAISDQRFFAVLTSIFFEQFFSFILSRMPEQTEQDIYFLIDEASSLKLPTLPLAMANIRKHRAGCAIIVQDFNQLLRNYGKQDAEAIRSNCYAKLYFGGSGQETTQSLESILGKTEVTDADGKKKVLPLMTADAIRTMQSDQAILLCGNLKPMLVKLNPFYNNSTYRRNAAMVAPTHLNQIPFNEIPTLSLDTDEDDEE